jgi:hypothetical protein
MEPTEEQKQMLAATPWLTENQKQAVSLLQTLSEEEVAKVVEWVLPILACVTSTNDVKRALQHPPPSQSSELFDHSGSCDASCSVRSSVTN